MSAATLLAGPQAWLAENAIKLGLAAAGAAALFIGGCHFGEMRMAEANGKLQADVSTCKASVTGLEGAVHKQNDAAEAARAEGAARLRASQDATARAVATLDRLSKLKAQADAYQRPAGKDECAAARDIVEKDNPRK